MTRQNPSNPFTRDPSHTKKDLPMPFKKAKVLAARGSDDNGFHTVRVRVYGDNAPYDAPVLAPVHGSIWIPEPGTDVIVLFTDEDKPIVIGSWYAVDRVEEGEVDLPDYEPGDIRLGNKTDSHVTVHENGTINIRTEDYEPVNIDTQGVSAYLSSVQTISADTPTKVNLGATNFDSAELFDVSQNAIVVKEGGIYDMRGKVRVTNPGQNNIVRVAVRTNDGELLSQNTNQTVVNSPVGVETSGYRRLEEGDIIELYVENDVSSDLETDLTELSIARQGV